MSPFLLIGGISSHVKLMAIELTTIVVTTSGAISGAVHVYMYNNIIIAFIN